MLHSGPAFTLVRSTSPILRSIPLPYRICTALTRPSALQSSSCTLRLKLSHLRRNRSSLFLSAQGESRCQANCLPANPSISSSAIRKSPSARSKKRSARYHSPLSASAPSSAPASSPSSAQQSPAAKPRSPASSTRLWPNTSFTTPRSAAVPAPARPSRSRSFWLRSSARSPAFAMPSSPP